jgi:regulator of protease activity HflC (stomatin/prohibitin superfamily)
MKKLIVSLVAAVVAVSCCCSCSRIDAGHEGIMVHLYGTNKGVDDVELVTGMVWYNPFTTSVYEYPTFVQTVDYEPFEFNSKDGSVFRFDPTIMLSLKPTAAPEVFKKYRKDMDDILEETLVTIIQDAFKEEINVRTDNELISDQTAFQNAVEERLKKELLSENFIVTKVSTGIKYPDALVEAITAKNVAIQEKATVENQVAIAEAQARKAIIEAQAERDANALRTASLTPAILQQMWIEKWNGEVPTVITNGNSSTFIDLSKIGK